LLDPFGAAVLVCVPVTLFLLTSKGTHVNHLVDASVAGGLAIGSAFIDDLRTRRAQIALVVATTLGIAEMTFLDGMESRSGELQRAANALPSGAEPVLSEQPWIPLLAHERAFMIDAYNLLQMRHSTPGIEADFMARIDHCQFRAVVLFGRPERAPWWYEGSQFGPGFEQHLLAHYAFHGVFGSHAFYVPRCGAAAATVQDVTTAQEPTILERGVRQSAIREFLSRLFKH
jgi:hypothetical protein